MLCTILKQVVVRLYVPYSEETYFYQLRLIDHFINLIFLKFELRINLDTIAKLIF